MDKFMITEQKIELIIEMHKSGAPISDIAEVMGVSLVTIKRWIANIRREHDLPYRSKSTQKTNLAREQKHVEETPWNLELARDYLTRQWG